MRVLQIEDNGELSLIERFGTNIPPYAILSHTWSLANNEEVIYQDILNDTAKEKAGYRKIQFCVEQSMRDSLKHFWIDTCCIDKSSSAELSEAIASMFRWYQESVQCYVYLSDVSSNKRKAGEERNSTITESAFRTSRWFLRGWTLQELLAPPVVNFFSREGQKMGDKLSLEEVIHEITCIPILALCGVPLQTFDIKERMSWAEKRQTTREEDEAYSLLGIFGVSMPAIYGEGRESALRRLQKDIRELLGDANSSLNDNQKHKLLKSLRFDQIDARHSTIKDAHTRTCKWLLEVPKYLDWLDDTKSCQHHGFLWIKGKPGTGKSTLMKYALAQARETPGNTTVISFFFHARGEDIERSTLGMYRSLLYQIFVRHPALQNVFSSLGLSIMNFSESYPWNVELLKSLMKQVVISLGNASLICFVDALDECEEEKIRDMVQFFESIGEITVSNHIRFRICFSSRHYPYITIRRGWSLVLERQEGHAHDISRYIETELKIGNGAQTIRSELQKKSLGIFMWVVLVVSILNKEHDAGRVHTLQRRLQELPSGLHDLFRDILTRDLYRKDELLLCIQWVLFAKKPLSPEQLYFAILSTMEPKAVLEGWDPTVATKDVIERFILNSSKGLAVVSNSMPRRVQFIHESVRDFLLKENGLGDIWPEFESNFDGQTHEQLKHCCLMALTLHFSTVVQIEKDLSEYSRQREDNLRDYVVDTFPFLEYAVLSVLDHADAAEECGIMQKPFLDSFPLSQWIQMANLFGQNFSRQATFLYILAMFNAASLIRLLPSASLCLEMESERYRCPLFAAIITMNEEAVNACFEAIEARSGKGTSSCDLDYKSYAREIVRFASARSFTYFREEGLFPNAMQLGGWWLVVPLIRLNKLRVDLKDDKGRTPLWWACEYGWESVVKPMLLSTTTEAIDIQDQDGKSALRIAVEKRRETVVRLLLEAGANPDLKGGFYGNALQAASRKGYKGVVTLLLEAGANVNAQADFYGNALQAASRGGYKEIVTLLLRKGAIINQQGGPWGCALRAASRANHKDIVTLLLDNGALWPLD